jgi:hypothetical protein
VKIVKIRKSFLAQPGELTFGARKVPRGLAVRMRAAFLAASTRLFILAMTCFFVKDLFETTIAFDTMATIAPQYVWGAMLVTIAGVLLIGTVTQSGRWGRAGLVTSGTLMCITGASFLSVAWTYGVGWWGVVGYFGLAAFDFVTASYSGEVK